MERELSMYLGDGVAMNVNRLSRPTPAVTEESLLAMKASVDQAVKDLAMCYPLPSAIIYGCTSGSFVSGPGKQEEMSDRIKELVGIPAITTSSALIDSLRHIGAKNTFLVTPYTEDITSKEIDLMTYHGLHVTYSDSIGCTDARDIAKISTDQVAERVLRSKDLIADCDSVFISCTQLLTMTAIDELESKLGVPVISSNQCSLWAVLKMIGGAANANAPGALLKELIGK